VTPAGEAYRIFPVVVDGHVAVVPGISRNWNRQTGILYAAR
jgi:hypothetical protein